MVWATASCVFSLLIVALALYAARCYLAAIRALKREHELKLQQLQSLLTTAEETTARLQAAIRRAESLQASESLPARPRGDALAAIEGLADPAALDSPDSLDQVAANLPPQSTAPLADIFGQDDKVLSVSRLSHQGLKPSDIARRLSLPIGEVEFLLSLRPASQA